MFQSRFVFKLMSAAILLVAISQCTEAQFRPLQKLRERQAENWGSTSNDGVVSLRKRAGVIVDYAPDNPSEIPSFADGFDRRIRIVNGNGEFYNRYFDQNGQIMGGNWNVPPEYSNRIYNDIQKNFNRATAPPRQSNPGVASASSRYQSMQSYANNINNAYRQRSEVSRASSTKSLNDFGKQIRNSMSATPFESSSGGERLIFNDNVPRR